ncbi:MAG: SDR family oxidoreductase [Rhodospirillaceae bacterium]|nr:SDR family oxidoreductase [Rhodospirillaceae bacterium]
MLEGKSAVITGASQGIGAGIALHFARAGADVMLVARSADKLDALAADITRETGRKATGFAVDLREEDSGDRVIAAALEAFGKLDIVACSAGATKRGDFFELTEADFMDGFALKFHHMVRVTRAAWPHLVKSGGNVVNIIGAGGRTPGADFTIGGPVNSACMNFTKAMADRGISEGVRVNAINPGPVRTPRLEGNVERISKERGITKEEALDVFRQQFGVTRVGEIDDIARMAVFLASEEGSLMQSAIVDMDGGATKGL